MRPRSRQRRSHNNVSPERLTSIGENRDDDGDVNDGCHGENGTGCSHVFVIVHVEKEVACLFTRSSPRKLGQPAICRAKECTSGCWVGLTHLRGRALLTRARNSSASTGTSTLTGLTGSIYRTGPGRALSATLLPATRRTRRPCRPSA